MPQWPQDGDVLGRRHPALRRLRSLARDAAARRREGLFIAEGFHLAREALRRDARMVAAILAPGFGEHPEGPALAAELARLGVPRWTISEASLRAISTTRSPQPVLLVVQRPAYDAAAPMSAPVPLVIGTVAMQDPGNLGSILRSAEALGAAGLWKLGGGVDPFHPRVVRASMGAAFSFPILETTAGEARDRIRTHRLRVWSLRPGDGTPIHEVPFDGPTLIWVGGEARGVPDDADELWGAPAHIPMDGPTESLSAPAAAAVALYEAARRRR